jgi:hypothetical protein
MRDLEDVPYSSIESRKKVVDLSFGHGDINLSTSLLHAHPATYLLCTAGGSEHEHVCITEQLRTD